MIAAMRATSLAGRFLATLLATAVLPLLAYGWFSLRGMRAQADEQVARVYLPQLAADHAERIQSHFERTQQACAIVREMARRVLDAPPAVRAQEVAAFDEQVLLVPDLLDNFLDLLLLVDAEGAVVTWRFGQRLDPAQQQRRAALIPARVADAPWFQRAQRERGLCFGPWGRSELLHRGLDFRSMDPGSHHIGLALDVPRGDGPPGVLYALVRWSEVQRVLDDAQRAVADRAGMPGAEVALVGPDGLVRAHTDRAHYGLPLPSAPLRAQAAAAAAMGHAAYADAAGREWRAGLAPCAGPAAGGQVVVVTAPAAELFAATDAYERVLLAAIAALVAVVVAWSLLASRAITAPVQALVAATRRIASGHLDVAVASRGGKELGLLARSFNQMAGELDAGRKRLAAAERDQAWAEMARQVAHEVKNPLQPMRMAAQLLQRARSEKDPRADLVAERLAKTVLEQTEALDRIASDFRAFAGIAPAQMTVVAVDAWLAEICQQCAGLFAGKPVDVAYAPGAGEARIAIDPKSLARVFVNLVQNAHEAAPAGVKVRVRSAVVDQRAVVTVVDDGPGIPTNVLGRLFTPYFTTKSSGTGLGLAICRRLVEAHGGTIQLRHSGAGETVFELALPLAASR
jgi:signal transduction histidine kinase